MKTVFESHCNDYCYEAVGARKLKNSLKYFHPDIPFKIFGDADIAAKRPYYPWLGWATLDPILCSPLAEEYDLVVHLDADSIVTGTLDDILAADFDIAGVRNNNDKGLAGATGSTFGNHIKGIDARWQYLNAGLIASTSKAFWAEFLYNNEHYANNTSFGEQDVWNDIFWSRKYLAKLLDDKDAKVHYGISSQCVEPGQRVEQSWADMYLKDDKLYFRDKVVKVMHNAGGFGLPKLQYQTWVKPDVKEFLDEITKD